jgi:hypothetical protein
MLHHDHSVSPARNRGAGHDLYGLAGIHLTVKYFTRANLADNAQSAWGIRCTDCEAIAHRARDCRVIAIGVSVARQDSAGSTVQANLLDRRGASRGCDAIDYAGSGVLKG